ncbi:MAG: hypothetical protein ACC742_12880 [Thermoanaerobaculales bacterium]
MRGWNAIAALIVAAGCGGGNLPPSFQEVTPSPRRVVVWLGPDGLDGNLAEVLRLAGVDEVVVRRGSVNLAGRAPVLRLRPAPAIAGAIPVGIALEVGGVREGLDEAMAEAMWRGIESELGDAIPAELILDLPMIPDGLDGFVSHLAQVAGVPVVPVLGFEQLQTEEGRRLAVAARGCIVPAFGTDGADLRGVRELDPLPLVKKLEPMMNSGIRIRPAIVLRPRTEPVLDGPLEDLDALTEDLVAEVSTASTLDRGFIFKKETEWSGRRWQPGQRVDVRWIDAARLHEALQEIHRVMLPEVGGWDLVPLPEENQGLGLGRDVLIRYLSGEGPAPDIHLRVERRGRTLKVILSNTSPFSSAVSNFGNWVEVSVDAGRLVTDDRGGFERVGLGTYRREEWQLGGPGEVNAVRFNEVYVAPGEEITSGRVRLPSSRSRVTVRWRVVLGDGSELRGTAQY